MNPAEQYILNQNEPYQSILLQLQSIVKAIAPNAELLFKWQIPFYFNNGIPICFLNQSKDYVDLGFWHYDKMEKYSEFFVDTNRKYVRSLRFQSVEDINDDIIIYVLQR